MATLSNNSEAIAITGIAPMCAGAKTVDELAVTGRSQVSIVDGANGAWFDPASYLGQRKFKYLTKATQYALAAAGVALADAAIDENTYSPKQCGAILGTNFGVCGVHGEMDKVVLSESAMALSPMEAANFSVNLAASHISLRYGFRAFNVCLTSSIVAGLEAIIFSAHALQRGRCSVALAGATEDQAPQSAAALIGGSPAGGAACLLTLERLGTARQRGAKTYAVLGKASLRFAPPASIESSSGRRRLEYMIGQQLDQFITPEQHCISYCPLRVATPLNRAVDEIVTAQLACRGVRVCRTAYKGADGAYMAVSPVLQLAAAAVNHPECLMTAASHEGHIAMLALHAPGADQQLEMGRYI